MSLPPSLLFSARSTYRSVLRSARVTFAGDLPRRAALESAVRETFKSPTLTPPAPSSSSPSPSSSSPSSPSASSTSSSSSPASSKSASHSTSSTATPSPDPELISQRLAEWTEIALFLRRNVVQGTMDESGSYKLRLTKDTELNDNERNQPSPSSSPQSPLTPFPNRDKKRKCGETPPEAPAFW